MPIKIHTVFEDSLADLAGLRAGDLIIEINDSPIEDFLDLQFHSSNEFFTVKYHRNNEIRQANIINDWSSPLGIEPEPHKCRTCTNDCIFCFVDQMPRGLRSTLNIKDDDYRLSFVYGNFITLTNLTEKDYRKIFDKNLSPLYISVHTTDPVLHKKILRYSHDFIIMDHLRKLSDKGIQLHTQIVVIPGWNDGQDLRNTLDDLQDADLNILSIGIVPVGLTKYRKSLTSISSVSPETAEEILTLSQNYSRTYCSDEIFLLSGREIPPEEYYDDYPQLENGIGMLRLLLENWKSNKRKFLKDLKMLKLTPVLICGVLVKDFLQKIVHSIKEESGIEARISPVENNFFGSSVTVTGLLTGRDIIDQTNINKDEIAVLSNSIFNPDGLTIDNMSKENLCRKLGKKVMVVDEEFADWEICS